MRVLLDTNILIYRETSKVLNPSIGNLFYWLDILKYDKVIHPLSIQEISKYKNPEELEVFKVKLLSYVAMKTSSLPSQDFLSKIKDLTTVKQNDDIDNVLLYEVYIGKVDLLITEDRKMHLKADRLGISNKVITINRFVSEATYNNPQQVNYSMLAVKQVCFGDVSLDAPFFDNFKQDYKGFSKWFNKKCDEPAYICYNEDNALQGFLYLKVENVTEVYNDIVPSFQPKKRLKIGTFKVESTGFRLGERFVKIIFDNALQYNVEEIYVTLFKERQELMALYSLLLRWGFIEWGTKTTDDGVETVLVKKMEFDKTVSVKQNFPNVSYNARKLILPIFPKYHTRLLPDSILKNENEDNFLDNSAYSYALQKVYISWAGFNEVKTGDLILFYRTGETSPKKYSSVITTVGVVDQIIKHFENKNDFLQHCQNRSVFSTEELEHFWNGHSRNLCVLKFLHMQSLPKKVTLGFLWDKGIVAGGDGPRSFTQISDRQFDMILEEANANIKFS